MTEDEVKEGSDQWDMLRRELFEFLQTRIKSESDAAVAMISLVHIAIDSLATTNSKEQLKKFICNMIDQAPGYRN